MISKLQRPDLGMAESVPGLIPPIQGVDLLRLASTVQPYQSIVELGSYKGRSACFLAMGSKAGFRPPVYAVDPWDLPGNVTGRFGYANPETREAFESNVRRLHLEDIVVQVQAYSTGYAESYDGPMVGLLYIDGDHGYRSVRGDYRAWERHLAGGAHILFDDLDTPKNPGVRRFVDELAAELGQPPSILGGGRVAWFNFWPEW